MKHEFTKDSIKVFLGSSCTIYKVQGANAPYYYNGHSIMFKHNDEPVVILKECNESI